MAEPMPRGRPTRRQIDPLSALFIASGDEVLGELAKQRQKSRSGGKPVSVGEGVLYDAETGESFTPQAYTDAVRAKREHEANIMRERYGLRQKVAEAAARRLKESTHQKVAGKQVEANIGDALLDRYKEALEAGEEILEPVAGAPAAVMRKFAMPGAAALYERATDTPAAINLRSAIADYIGPYRHARFGAQLTGNEISEFEKVNPLAFGISHEASMDRLRRIRDWYGQHADELAAGRTVTGEGPTKLGPETVPMVPERPEGVTDDEWESWLEMEGYL